MFSSLQEKSMPPKGPSFAVEVKEVMKNFLRVVRDAAFGRSNAMKTLRRKLLEESSIDPGTRRKNSKTFMKYLKTNFKTMRLCRSDAGCLKQLFKTYLFNLPTRDDGTFTKGTEKKFVEALESIQILLYLQSFPRLGNNYMIGVSGYRTDILYKLPAAYPLYYCLLYTSPSPRDYA